MGDDFKYRYYFNGPLSDLYSLPTDPKPATSDYPFAMKCYAGCTYEDLSNEESKCTGGSTGVTDNYVATVTEGVTDMFVSGPATDRNMLCSEYYGEADDDDTSDKDDDDHTSDEDDDDHTSDKDDDDHTSDEDDDYTTDHEHDDEGEEEHYTTVEATS